MSMKTRGIKMSYKDDSEDAFDRYVDVDGSEVVDGHVDEFVGGDNDYGDFSYTSSATEKANRAPKNRRSKANNDDLGLDDMSGSRGGNRGRKTEFLKIAENLTLQDLLTWPPKDLVSLAKERAAEGEVEAPELDEKSKQALDEIQNGEKRLEYSCPHCGVTMKSKGGMLYHIRKSVCINKVPRGRGSTGKAAILADANSKFVCPLCEISYTTLPGLRFHVNQQMTARGHYDCFDQSSKQPTTQQLKYPTSLSEVPVDFALREIEPSSYPWVTSGSRHRGGALNSDTLGLAARAPASRESLPSSLFYTRELVLPLKDQPDLVRSLILSHGALVGAAAPQQTAWPPYFTGELSDASAAYASLTRVTSDPVSHCQRYQEAGLHISSPVCGVEAVVSRNPIACMDAIAEVPAPDSLSSSGGYVLSVPSPSTSIPVASSNGPGGSSSITGAAVQGGSLILVHKLHVSHTDRNSFLHFCFGIHIGNSFIKDIRFEPSIAPGATMIGLLYVSCSDNRIRVYAVPSESEVQACLNPSTAPKLVFGRNPSSTPSSTGPTVKSEESAPSIAPEEMVISLVPVEVIQTPTLTLKLNPMKREPHSPFRLLLGSANGAVSLCMLACGAQAGSFSQPSPQEAIAESSELGLPSFFLNQDPSKLGNSLRRTLESKVRRSMPTYVFTPPPASFHAAFAPHTHQEMSATNDSLPLSLGPNTGLQGGSMALAGPTGAASALPVGAVTDIDSLSLYPDIFVSGHSDGVVRLWSLNCVSPLLELTVGLRPITQVSLVDIGGSTTEDLAPVPDLMVATDAGDLVSISLSAANGFRREYLMAAHSDRVPAAAVTGLCYTPLTFSNEEFGGACGVVAVSNAAGATFVFPALGADVRDKIMHTPLQQDVSHLRAAVKKAQAAVKTQYFFDMQSAQMEENQNPQNPTASQPAPELDQFGIPITPNVDAAAPDAALHLDPAELGYDVNNPVHMEHFHSYQQQQRLLLQEQQLQQQQLHLQQQIQQQQAFEQTPVAVQLLCHALAEAKLEDPILLGAGSLDVSTISYRFSPPAIPLHLFDAGKLQAQANSGVNGAGINNVLGPSTVPPDARVTSTRVLLSRDLNVETLSLSQVMLTVTSSGDGVIRVSGLFLEKEFAEYSTSARWQVLAKSFGTKDKGGRLDISEPTRKSSRGRPKRKSYLEYEDDALLDEDQDDDDDEDYGSSRRSSRRSGKKKRYTNDLAPDVLDRIETEESRESIDI